MNSVIFKGLFSTALENYSSAKLDLNTKSVKLDCKKTKEQISFSNLVLKDSIIINQETILSFIILAEQDQQWLKCKLPSIDVENFIRILKIGGADFKNQPQNNNQQLDQFQSSLHLESNRPIDNQFQVQSQQSKHLVNSLSANLFLSDPRANAKLNVKQFAATAGNTPGTSTLNPRRLSKIPRNNQVFSSIETKFKMTSKRFSNLTPSTQVKSFKSPSPIIENNLSLKNMKEFKRVETFAVVLNDINFDVTLRESFKENDLLSKIQKNTILSPNPNELSPMTIQTISPLSRKISKTSPLLYLLEKDNEIPESKMMQEHDSLAEQTSKIIENNRKNLFLKFASRLSTFLLDNNSFEYRKGSSALNAFELFFKRIDGVLGVKESFSIRRRPIKRDDFTGGLNCAVQIATRRKSFNFRVKKRDPTKIFAEEGFNMANTYELPFSSENIELLKDSDWNLMLKDIDINFNMIASIHFTEANFKKMFVFPDVPQSIELGLTVKQSFSEDLADYLCSLLTKSFSLTFYASLLSHINRLFNTIADKLVSLFWNLFCEAREVVLCKIWLVLFRTFLLEIEEVRVLYVSFFSHCATIQNFYKQTDCSSEVLKKSQKMFLVKLFGKDATNLFKSSKFSIAEMIHGLIAASYKDQFSVLTRLKEEIERLLSFLNSV